MVKYELVFAEMILILQYQSRLLLYFGHKMKAETENITSLNLLLSLDLEISADKPNTLQFWYVRYLGVCVGLRGV